MAECRKQQILDHISRIDLVISINESCIMNLQKGIFENFSATLHLESSKKSMMNRYATYEEALETYLGNIDWLKRLRTNWLNSI